MTHGKRSEWQTDGVLLSAPEEPGPIDMAALFGNTRPVELEIGSGKGTFLLARASARPEVNFIGIEWARTYCQYTADRMKRAGLTNVRMICADAKHFISRFLADRCLLRMHIYFPDPWPKKRHHNRRTIQAAFLEQVHRVLMPGGQLLVVTDHMGYFEQIDRVLAAARGFAHTGFPIMADREGEVVGTNFERKYIAQGRPFYKRALLRLA